MISRDVVSRLRRAEEEYYYMPGATTVGIRCTDGVVLASEKRVTYGFYMLSRSGRKVFRVTNRIGVAFAGILADMQTLTKLLRYYISLYELENKSPISVRAAAKLLSVILFNSRIMPYFAETIVGGIDDEGAHIFVLDPLGSLIEDKYAALGTGAKIAIGIIEDQYRDTITVKEGREIAIRAIKRAIERDAVSGDGIDILVITQNGTEEEFIPIPSST